ncbi:MAG: hypothetical protein KME17_21745 [Cyanosarcina radialis HA8281-LM2]|jgi:hypothetical protein|nr:hypothetical protein [Cyanosarcina radialis HA8281-LM2]
MSFFKIFSIVISHPGSAAADVCDLAVPIALEGMGALILSLFRSPIAACRQLYQVGDPGNSASTNGHIHIFPLICSKTGIVRSFLRSSVMMYAIMVRLVLVEGIIYKLSSANRKMDVILKSDQSFSNSEYFLGNTCYAQAPPTQIVNRNLQYSRD